MSIQSVDVRSYKSINSNDTAGNGGYIGSTEITSNIANNLFPNVTSNERTNGVTRYRKMFVRNKNVSDLAMYSGEMWISSMSGANDYFRIMSGENEDTQADIIEQSNWAGAGLLDADVLSGESTISVEYDDDTCVWQNAKVRISDSINAVDLISGNPSWTGNTATFALSDVVGYNFNSGETVVSTIVSLGTLEASASSFVKTSDSGVYDDTTYPLVVFNAGTPSDSWTLIFNNSTSFYVVGAITGLVGTGYITSDFQPENSYSYYFKIDKDGWSGSWAMGDTITFTTSQAGKAVWVKEVVPAGIASYSNNTVELEWRGESA